MITFPSQMIVPSFLQFAPAKPSRLPEKCHVVISESLSSLKAEENLFYLDNKTQQDNKEDADSSDSEESEYSGLESESDTSDDQDKEQESVSFQNHNNQLRPAVLSVVMSNSTDVI